MRLALVGACGLAGLLLAGPAHAQTRPPAPPAPAPAAKAGATGEPAGDVEAAFDVGMSLRNRGESVSYKKGWHVGASYRLTRIINVMAEGGGDYRTLSSYTANIYSYTGGVRFQHSARRAVNPFAQVMMGAAQDNGDGSGEANHYPVVAPGGGVDARLANRLALRVRVDFPLYMTFGDVFKGTRLAVGLSVPFGTRR